MVVVVGGGGVEHQRENESEPEAEHDGLRPWGAVSLKDRESEGDHGDTVSL